MSTPYRTTIATEHTDFGVVDSKGRRLGARVTIYVYSAEYLAECKPARDLSKAHRVEVSATRDGKDFGASANGSGLLGSIEECRAYIAKYLAGARRTAERRAKIEAQRKAAREAFAART